MKKTLLILVLLTLVSISFKPAMADELQDTAVATLSNDSISSPTVSENTSDTNKNFASKQMIFYISPEQRDEIIWQGLKANRIVQKIFFTMYDPLNESQSPNKGLTNSGRRIYKDDMAASFAGTPLMFGACNFKNKALYGKLFAVEITKAIRFFVLMLDTGNMAWNQCDLAILGNQHALIKQFIGHSSWAGKRQYFKAFEIANFRNKRYPWVAPIPQVRQYADDFKREVYYADLYKEYEKIVLANAKMANAKIDEESEK